MEQEQNNSLSISKDHVEQLYKIINKHDSDYCSLPHATQLLMQENNQLHDLLSDNSTSGALIKQLAQAIVKKTNGGFAVPKYQLALALNTKGTICWLHEYITKKERSNSESAQKIVKKMGKLLNDMPLLLNPSIEMAQSLLSFEKTVNASNQKILNFYKSESFIHAIQNNQITIMNLLIEHNVDINAPLHWNGYTPIMVAAVNGHVDILNMLITKKANANLSNSDGTTALMLAAETGTTEAVRILLNAGAYAHAQNNKRQTALDLVKKEIQTCKKIKIKQYEQTIALIENHIKEHNPVQQCSLMEYYA